MDKISIQIAANSLVCNLLTFSLRNADSTDVRPNEKPKNYVIKRLKGVWHAPEEVPTSEEGEVLISTDGKNFLFQRIDLEGSVPSANIY